MGRLLEVLLSALGPVVAVGMVFLAEWLTAFVPHGSVPDWAVTAVVVALWIGALGITVFGSFRGFAEHWLAFAFIGTSFFALGFALNATQSAVDAKAFQDRGRITTCTIEKIQQRTESHTDADGNTTTSTYYDQSLHCAAAHVGTLTTGEPAGKRGTRIRVEYDPTTRLLPRLPEDDVTDVAGWRRSGVIALVIAMIVRGGMELFPASYHDGFFGSRYGLARIRFGLTIFVAIIATMFVVFATYHGVRWATGAAFDTMGIPRQFGAQCLASGATGVLCALGLNYLLDLVRKAGLALLRRFRHFLDPQGEFGELLAEVDISVMFSVHLFGFQLMMDAGLLGFLGRFLKARFRRSRGRRKR